MGEAVAPKRWHAEDHSITDGRNTGLYERMTIMTTAMTIDHLYGDPEALKDLFQQAEFMDAPPWNTPPKKLADALKAVEQQRVMPDTDAPGLYIVVGSTGEEYQIDSAGCSCPARKKAGA